MKKYINKLIEKLFGFRLIKSSLINQKEQPTPFMSSQAKRFLYHENIYEIIKTFDGNIVECGVGWGRSLYHFCLLAEIEKKNRQIWGFDSFEGFPETSEYDETSKTGKGKGHYKTNEQSVKNYLINSGIDNNFINENLRLIKGFFPTSFQHYDKVPISLLHLDCDLFQSYLDSLNFFYPMVEVGGVIAFDDYNRTSWPGARKAVDQFFQGKEKIIKSGIIDQYYIIKK